jgi:O-antigen/teichoic acid export membrane protein
MRKTILVDSKKSVVEKADVAREPHNDAVKKIARGAGITFVGKIISAGLKYLTQMSIARLMGVEVFGLYALGFTIYQLVELFSRMGIEIGSVRYVSIYYSKGDEPRLKGVLLQVMGLPFLGGLVFGAALFFSSTFIAYEILKKPDLVSAIRIFAMALPFGASMTVAAFATTGFHVTKYLVYVLELFQPFIFLAFVILFYTLGLGLFGTALAWVMAVIMGLALSFYFIRKVFPAITCRKIKPVFECKQLLAFSLPLTLGSFLWLVMLWTDILILGYFWSAKEVGIYRAVSQTCLLLVMILHSLNSIFAPMIADLYNRKEIEKIRMLFQTTTFWSFTLTLPLFLTMSIASKDIMSMFGREFEVGWLTLIILGAGQFINAGTGGAVSMLIMSGHQYLKVFGDLGLAILNVVLNIILIPKLGLLGAALATGISIAMLNLLRLIQVYFVLGMQPYSWKYLKPIVAGVVAVSIGFAIRTWILPMHFLLSLLITGCTIFLVYAVLIWIFRMDEVDRMILVKVRNRLGF